MSASLRSMLYVPGSDERKLARAASLANPLILDLEDAVAPSAKERARGLVRAFIDAHGSGQAIHVRINGMGTDLALDDLEAVVHPALAGLVVPKVEAAWQLQALDWAVHALERRAGLAHGSIGLTATVETTRGVRAVDSIASAVPRLRRLALGGADLSTELGLRYPEPGDPSPTLQWARAAVITASLAAGLEPPHDGASLAIQDLDALRRESTAAKHLGFCGKHAIHPDQVAVIDEIFQPDEAELESARRVVDAFEASERDGIGAIDIGGQLVDYPVAVRARRLLERGT